MTFAEIYLAYKFAVDEEKKTDVIFLDRSFINNATLADHRHILSKTLGYKLFHIRFQSRWGANRC